MKRKSTVRTTSGVASMASSHQIETKTQWSKYPHKGGHGFVAEDINTMHDRMKGCKVDQCGRSNSLNGPDRIVDRVPIQTKTCRTAAGTFRSAFDKTGRYRYSGQQFEVPSDQYEELVSRFRQAIREGKVAGVSDPEQASKILVKGRYTYAQLKNMAKAGTLDSIKFDTRIQVSACVFAYGISGGLAFILAKCNGESTKNALKIASISGLKSAGITMVSGVAVQQILRTSIGRSFAAAAAKTIHPAVQSAMKTELGKKVIAKTASGIIGKQVAGNAAANVLTKAARTNVIVSSAVAIATIGPDIINCCRGKISIFELGENTACNVSGIGGGWAGGVSGAAVGSRVCPGVGTAVGGIIGGVLGGLGATTGTKKLINYCKTIVT